MGEKAVNDTIDILLIYPDFRSDGVFSDPGLPVGLGFIARSLQTAGFNYEVIDLNIASKQYLLQRIKETSPPYLGISLLSYRSETSYELLQSLKSHFPRIKIVAGGPHITANKGIALRECPAIDIGVSGEGEIAICEILAGKPLRSIKGVLYREEENVRFSGEREFIEDLDSLPYPTYHGFDLEKYGRTIPIHSSRGCPYNCIFCGAPRILGKRWRKRSAPSIIEEVRYWYNLGFRQFCFSDSNFAVDRARVVSLCEAILDNSFHAHFVAEGLRADHVDRELLAKMKRAGFTSVTFGVESGSDKILKNLRKGETLHAIEAAIAAASDTGLVVSLFFLIGSPGETKADIQESFKLATRYPVARVYFFNLTPLPGTQFYDWAIEQGIIDGTQTKYPEDNFGFSDRAFLRTDVMSVNQLTHYIGVARRVERQVKYKYGLHRFLHGIKLDRLRSHQPTFDSISWFASDYHLSAVIDALWNLGALLKNRYLKVAGRNPQISHTAQR